MSSESDVPFSLLDCSVRVEQCGVNDLLNEVQKDNQLNDTNTLDGRSSQNSEVVKEFDVSYEDYVKCKKRVSFSDQILVYELKNEYKCQKCPEIFSKPSKLRHHIQRTHKSKQYICYYCRIKYSRRDLFKAHIKLHCDVCKRLLNSRQQYMEHRQTVCGISNKFTCYICQINYFTEIDLQYHIANHLVLPYHCERCKKHFLSQCSLTHHIYNNHTNRHFEDLKVTRVSDTVIYRCHHCEQSSAYREEIEKHLEIYPDFNENMEKNIEYICDLCDSKFHSEQDLVKHKWSHYMDSQNDNNKQTPEQTTESVESDFSKALRNKKVDLKNGIPDFVSAHFNPKLILEKLDLSILNNSDVIYNNSPQEVNNGNLLIEINKKKIQDNYSTDDCTSKKSPPTNKLVAEYQCNICLSYYISSYNLNRHINSVHNKQCIYCHKTFITRRHLKGHKCTKILEVPMADERSVVSRDDLKKPSSVSDICTVSSKSDDNNLQIVEVKSLNTSYNILQTMEHIRLNKFNVKNKTPKCLNPRVLVERMDFSNFLNRYITNDVIDLDNDDDDCVIVPNIVESILKDFDTQKDYNNDKIKPKDASQKSLVGKIRVIQNTTKNFIDADDPRPITKNRKSVNHNAHNISVKSYGSKEMTSGVNNVPVIEISNVFNDHDATDDIPINILHRPPAISVNTNSNVGPEATPSRTGMPPRILNNELADIQMPPNIVNPDTLGQSNPPMTMDEISRLGVGAIVLGKPGLEGARVGTGYLMRIQNNNQKQHSPRIIRPVIYMNDLQHQNGQTSTVNNIDSVGIQQPNNTDRSPLLNSMLTVNHVPPWLQPINEQISRPPNVPIIAPNIQQNQVVISNHLNSMNMNMGSNVPYILDKQAQAQAPMLNSEPVLNRLTHNVQPGSCQTQENVQNYVAIPSLQSKTNNEQDCTKEHVCKVCNKYYAAKGALTLHLRKKHQLAYDYSVLTNICSLCNDAFQSLTALRRHERKCSAGGNSTDVTTENRQNDSHGNGQHQSFVCLTENQSLQHLGNGVVVGNTDTQQTMDIEIPILQNHTPNGNTSTIDTAQNTNTYEYNNYKVVLTEVPIEF